MRILAPAIGLAALRNYRPELRIRDHVRPRHWRRLCLSRRDDVFAAIGGKSAKPVVEEQRSRRHVDRTRGIGTTDERGPYPRRRWFRRRAPGNLVRETTFAVGDDRSRDALHQDAVFDGNLFGTTDEYASGTIEHVGLDTARDQSHDLIVQQLPVSRMVLVPDHQVDRETLQTPVRMRLNHLPNQIDVGRIADLQQNNGQIAGDGISPEARLPALIVAQNA